MDCREFLNSPVLKKIYLCIEINLHFTDLSFIPNLVCIKKCEHSNFCTTYISEKYSQSRISINHAKTRMTISNSFLDKNLKLNEKYYGNKKEFFNLTLTNRQLVK